MICSNRQHNKSSRQQGLGFPAYWEAHGEFQCEESGKVAVDGIIAAFRHILTGRKKGPPLSLIKKIWYATPNNGHYFLIVLCQQKGA